MNDFIENIKKQGCFCGKSIQNKRNVLTKVTNWNNMRLCANAVKCQMNGKCSKSK